MTLFPKVVADMWSDVQMQLALDRIRFGIMTKSQPEKPRSAEPAKKDRTQIKAARRQNVKRK